MNEEARRPAAGAARRIEWIDGERGFLVAGEERVPFAAAAGERATWVRWRGRTYRIEREESGTATSAADALATETAAPMPGVVRSVRVGDGDDVDAGALLLVLEAMKMEHEVRATAPARIVRVHVREGERVEAGAMLVELEAR